MHGSLICTVAAFCAAVVDSRELPRYAPDIYALVAWVTPAWLAVCRDRTEPAERVDWAGVCADAPRDAPIRAYSARPVPQTGWPGARSEVRTPLSTAPGRLDARGRPGSACPRHGPAAGYTGAVPCSHSSF